MLKVRLKNNLYFAIILLIIFALSWLFLPFLKVNNLLLGAPETGSEYSLYEATTLLRINKNPLFPKYEVIFALEGYKVTSEIQLKRTLFSFKIISQSDTYLIEQV